MEQISSSAAGFHARTSASDTTSAVPASSEGWEDPGRGVVAALGPLGREVQVVAEPLCLVAPLHEGG
ncbi:hypothetical protein F9C11_12555 [Amycolatopsis sp. VS8301801F10]|uniref:hypothetical protein n=1 Tax=Amycolatopsis sp. VS8301801F10 TaxID=2652442 RepID=UPI0038FBF723